MKYNILFILIAVLTLATACGTESVKQGSAELSSITNRITLLDSLTNSGAADTVTQSLGFYGSPTRFYVQIAAENVSGTSSGTANLQYDPGLTGSDWVTIATTAISGASTVDTVSHSSLGGRYRYYIIASDTTSQRTDIRFEVLSAKRSLN